MNDTTEIEFDKPPCESIDITSTSINSETKQASFIVGEDTNPDGNMKMPSTSSSLKRNMNTSCTNNKKKIRVSNRKK